MRISDRYQSTIERVATAKPALPTTKAAPTTSTTDGTSGVLDVKVSDKAHELSARADQVAALKKQIQDGSFKVDPDAIASTLIGGDE